MKSSLEKTDEEFINGGIQKMDKIIKYFYIVPSKLKQLEMQFVFWNFKYYTNNLRFVDHPNLLSLLEASWYFLGQKSHWIGKWINGDSYFDTCKGDVYVKYWYLMHHTKFEHSFDKMPEFSKERIGNDISIENWVWILKEAPEEILKISAHISQNWHDETQLMGITNILPSIGPENAKNFVQLVQTHLIENESVKMSLPLAFHYLYLS